MRIYQPIVLLVLGVSAWWLPMTVTHAENVVSPVSPDIAADQPDNTAPDSAIRPVVGVTNRFDQLGSELLNAPEAATAPPVTAPGAVWQLKQAIVPQAPAPGNAAAMDKLPRLLPYAPNRSTRQLATQPVLAPPEEHPFNRQGLMQQALAGAHTQAIQGARQVLAGKPPGPSASNSSVPLATVTDDDTPVAALSTATPTVAGTSAPSFFVPILKVPTWLWLTLAAVCVGFTLLATSGTAWLLQRVWQQRQLQQAGASNPDKNRLLRGLTLGGHDLTDPPDPVSPLPPVVPHKTTTTYATAPRFRRLDMGRLLQPRPSTVPDVLAHWASHSLVSY
jgi:hypothetical protein